MESKLNIYYVAIKETIQAGILPRLWPLPEPLRLNGLGVQKEWMLKKKEVNPNDTENIKIA
jgi:hypothetical protein